MLFIDIDKMATTGRKISRTPNFKQGELSVLVDEVEKNKTVILGKFSDTVSNERKKNFGLTLDFHRNQV
jgi:hypothetical protein